MFWTVLALLLWIVLGGFISYYGDLQGRRWGKKRVSWLGLRPKHTAILITSLTGAFIALCSVISLYAIAPTVREVIMRGERAIRENKRLASDYAEKVRASAAAEKDLNSKVRIAQYELDAAKQKNDALKIQLARLDEQRVTLSKKAAGARQETEDLQRQQQELERQRSGLIQQIAASNREIAQNKQIVLALRTQQRQLADKNRKLNRQVAQATIINTDLGKQNIALSQQKSELQSDNKTLQANIVELNKQKQLLEIQQKQLQFHNDELARANGALERTNTNLVSYNEELSGKNKTLNEKQDALVTRLAELEQAFQQSYAGLRQGRLNLRANAELARRTIDAHMRPEAVRRELAVLMQDANATALAYGARRGDNGMAARLITQQPMTAGAADESAMLDALATELAGRDAPIVIVANAAGNVMAKEQAVMELHSYSVTTIFDKGQAIATRRINARQDAGRVFEAIVQFLQQEVRDAAIKAGTVPHIDPESGAQQVGSLGTADLVALTERVRRKGGDVQISAIAAAPMTSADYPLNLRFDIKRAPSLPSIPVSPVSPALLPVGSDKRQRVTQ